MREQTTHAPNDPEAIRQAPTYTPLTDIYETDKELVLLAEMPGVDPGDVDIAIENRVLTVTARPTVSEPQGYTLVHAEYRDVDYQRAFTLSNVVDTSRIDAAMKDGVLRLTIPKTGPAPAKRIAVKRG